MHIYIDTHKINNITIYNSNHDNYYDIYRTVKVDKIEKNFYNESKINYNPNPNFNLYERCLKNNVYGNTVIKL
jgi:hypothetical protein